MVASERDWALPGSGWAWSGHSGQGAVSIWASRHGCPQWPHDPLPVLTSSILSERTVSAGSKIKHVLREACFHVEAKLETLVDGLCSARLFRMAGGLTSSEPGTITADLSDAADFAPGPQGKLHCRGCAQRLPPPTGRPGDPCLGSSAQRPQGGIKGQGGGEPSAPLRGSDGVAVDGLHPVQTVRPSPLSPGLTAGGVCSRSPPPAGVKLLWQSRPGKPSADQGLLTL